LGRLSTSSNIQHIKQFITDLPTGVILFLHRLHKIVTQVCSNWSLYCCTSKL